MRFLLTVCLFFISSAMLNAQTTLLDIDTTGGFGKNLLGLYKKFDNLRFSGYMQPQFQIADTMGTKSYNGGDFPAQSNNRFMLRRARIRLDYANYNKAGQPTVFFVFQFDGTERGVVPRDFWGRVFEHKLELFAMSAGIMARPFSQELLLSSSDRETPERGRMSQILTRTERDLGAMLTIEPRKKDSKYNFFRWDIMVSNGQGLTGTADFDSYKDLISRFFIKPQSAFNHRAKISGGISMLYGGIKQFGSKSYRFEHQKYILSDDTAHIGRKLPRHYYGADIQIKIPNKHGVSEFRAEYVRGLQTATAKNTDTPGIVPIESDGSFSPLYVRAFDGAYFYYLQHLGSAKHQLLLKYDWYDPNTKVSKKQVSNIADIKYNTFGIGYIYYFNTNLKFVLYYDLVKNEKTKLTGYTRDLKDNVFTTRMHFRF